MNKKVIFAIILLLVLILVVGILVSTSRTKGNLNENTQNNKIINTNNENETNDITTEENLVLYFSATGNTKQIAEYIQEITGSDIIQIIPKEEYTEDDLNYSNNNSRANIEQNDENARPEILNKIDVDKYDIIYLGYPIWWGNVPKIILTLIDSYNLEGKTVIPFCTSGSTGISQSMNTLKLYNKNINWIEGKRFSGSETKDSVEQWIDGLNINK